MSLSHRTGAYEMSAEDRDRKAQGYGFILALLCFALTLLVFYSGCHRKRRRQ